MEENDEEGIKNNKFVDIILKHRNALNLNVVSEQILEMRKENEKKEKKKEEKKKSILKLQDQTSKAAYFPHDYTTKNARWKDSPKTMPNFMSMQKGLLCLNLNKCETHANKGMKTMKNIENNGQNRFSIELQKFLDITENQTAINSQAKIKSQGNVNSQVNMNSQFAINTVKNSMNSMESIPDSNKFTGLANNVSFFEYFYIVLIVGQMIKILTDNLQKEMINNEKQLKNKNMKKNQKVQER